MILCDHNKLLSAVNFTYSGHPELRTPFECSDYISFHNDNILVLWSHSVFSSTSILEGLHCIFILLSIWSKEA